MAKPSLQPVQVISQPGIKRDGTQLDGEGYIDGRWIRFQRQRPRKMGGYRGVTSELDEKIYGMRVDGVNQVVGLRHQRASRLDYRERFLSYG
jgi:hypothetical protein